MDRRELLGFSAGGLALAVIPLPALAAASETPAFTTVGRVTWSREALGNRHLGLVAKWIDEQIAQGRTRVHDYLMPQILRLDDPRFVVQADKKIFNIVNGYTDEEGLSVTLYEGGLEVDKFGIAATHGAWREKIPEYFVRGPWLDWENDTPLMRKLGKKIEPDLSWLTGARSVS